MREAVHPDKKSNAPQLRFASQNVLRKFLSDVNHVCFLDAGGQHGQAGRGVEHEFTNTHWDASPQIRHYIQN